MGATQEVNGWNIGPVISYPADTAEALEHHVATDLAGMLYEAGVRPDDRQAALAALAEQQVHPLLISQCLTLALSLLQGMSKDGLRVIGNCTLPDLTRALSRGSRQSR